MEIKSVPLKGKEYLYTYRNSQQISSQTGLIGYIRADMGVHGAEFFSTWNGFRDELNTQDFKDEIDTVINLKIFVLTATTYSLIIQALITA